MAGEAARRVTPDPERTRGDELLARGRGRAVQLAYAPEANSRMTRSATLKGNDGRQLKRVFHPDKDETEVQAAW